MPYCHPCSWPIAHLHPIALEYSPFLLLRVCHTCQLHRPTLELHEQRVCHHHCRYQTVRKPASSATCHHGPTRRRAAPIVELVVGVTIRKAHPGSDDSRLRDVGRSFALDCVTCFGP